MSGPVLLIADGDEAICFALSRMARRHGFAPLVASDGVRAVALANSAGEHLAAVVLDVRVPRLDGIASALAIHKARPAVSVALMTAFGDGSPAAFGSTIALFQKPFDLAEFAG